MENTGRKHAQPEGSHIALLQINTLQCQQKQELEDKGKVHDSFIVHTAVGKKAWLTMKQH